MIRRTVSVLLFVFGGWMLLAELMMAFLDVDPGGGVTLLVIAIFGIIVGVSLLLGAWASPGKRWRELGLTILIAVGLTVLCGGSMAVMLMDPAFMRYMPPMPSVELAPVVGTINLLIVGAIGWLLYRERVSP